MTVVGTTSTGDAREPTSHYAARDVVSWLRVEPQRRHRRFDNAALIFLDISGFTAMSEMLAGLGRLGAEEVEEVVDRTFTALLDIAAEEGGSLLKFGGDALLLLFRGHTAAITACRVAWDLRDHIHAANPVTTAAGQLDLNLTMGVHAGPVDLFLVGDLHRELVVAGPAATAVIETEGAADKGQILVSPATAALLRPGDVVVDAEGRLELGARPQDTQREPAPRLVPTVVAQPVLSDPVERRALEDLGGEHRLAHIAFVHFAGTDQLLATEGPEGLADALDELIRLAQHACHDAGVAFLSSDVDTDGGKLILTSGVPFSADDDADRIVDAARRIVDGSPRLHVQIGINAGPVFAGVVGPPYRLTYTVLGDAVNLAARIMARAGHGEVLAEAEVLNRCRTLYAVQDIAPFHVKGKVAPVRAMAVGDDLGVRVRLRADTTMLAGRDVELSRLTTLADDLHNRGHAVALTGEAGIGKSRLIDELQERRPTLDYQLIACNRVGAERPWRAAAMLLRLALTGERHGAPDPVLDAARNVCVGDPTLSPWLPLLGDVYDVPVPQTHATRDLSPAFRSQQAIAFVANLLVKVLNRPTCLVIEDAQWLDPESRALSEQLLHLSLATQPWLVIVTTRETFGLPGVEEVRLGPIAAESCRSILLRAVDHGTLPIDRVDSLATRSGGNPLFLQELLRGASTGATADTLEGIFQQRLDLLPPRQRRLLAHAAVLGVEFPPELLLTIVEGASDVEATDLDLLLGDELARMRTGYLRFQQSLMQEVAYSNLPFRTRRRLHRRSAGALEALEAQGAAISVEALSRHHHLGGDFAGSWNSSRRAFDVARGRSATETAARFGRRAIEAAGRIGPPGDDVAQVWEALGDMLELAGNYDEADRAYRAARKHADVRHGARLCRKVGHTHERRGTYSQALRWYTRADRLAVAAAHGERVEILVRRAVARMRQGRGSEALRLAEGLVADGADQLATAELANVLWIQGWALGERLDPEATALLERAADLFGQVGDLGHQAIVINGSGARAYHQGHWTAAVGHYGRARDLWRREGDRGNEAVASANIGEVLGDQGHVDEARAALTTARTLGRATHHEALRLFAQLCLARLEARFGDVERATDLAADALARAREIGAGGFVMLASVRGAEAAWHRGDVDAVVDLATAATAGHPDAPPDVIATTQRLLGLAAAGGGDRQRGRKHLEAAVAEATAAGLIYDAWLASEASATLGLAPRDTAADSIRRRLGVVADPAVLSGAHLIGGRDGQVRNLTEQPHPSPAQR